MFTEHITLPNCLTEVSIKISIFYRPSTDSAEMLIKREFIYVKKPGCYWRNQEAHVNHELSLPVSAASQTIPLTSHSNAGGLHCPARTPATGTPMSVPYGHSLFHRSLPHLPGCSLPPRTGQAWLKRSIAYPGVWFTVWGCPHPPKAEDASHWAVDRSALPQPLLLVLAFASILGQQPSEVNTDPWASPTTQPTAPLPTTLYCPLHCEYF